MLSALAVSAPTALAAAPTNDTFANATAAAIGFSESLDTSEATTDNDDAQMIPPSCSTPATDASVWYVLQGSDQGVVVDVSQSNYSAGVLVRVGSLDNYSQTVMCGPGDMSFFAAAGTTYYILAIDDQNDGGGNGGQLSISFNDNPDIPRPPTLAFTVNRFGTANVHTGVATISGTYTCSNGDFISVFGFVSYGSFDFYVSSTCDGAPHSWSADVFPENGKFVGGKAYSNIFALSCGPFECSLGFFEQYIQLRGGGK